MKLIKKIKTKIEQIKKTKSDQELHKKLSKIFMRNRRNDLR